MTDSRKAKTCDSFGYEFEEFLLAIDYNLAFAAANGCIGPPRLQHNINNFGLDCDSCDAAPGLQGNNNAYNLWLDSGGHGHWRGGVC